MEIDDFIVREPSSSQEVTELAYRMLSEGGVLKLAIQKCSEDEQKDLEFRINQFRGDDSGGHFLSGKVIGENSWVRIHIRSDPEAAATAQMIQDQEE